jgi:hypothetical protein
VGHSLRRAAWPVVRIACDAVTALGIAGLAFQLAADRLPALLPALVEQLAPAVRLEVGAARFEGVDELVLRRVRLRTAAGEPILAAKRVVLRYRPWSLRAGTLDLVLLERPLLTLPPSGFATGGGDDGGATWRIGRLLARGGRFRLPERGGQPAASFRFAADLRDLGDAPELIGRPQRIAIKDVRLGRAGRVPLLAMRGALVEASLAGLRDRRIDELRLVSPAVTIADAVPALAGGDGEEAPWRVGRLLVQDGRVAVPATNDAPGIGFRVTTDLRDIATGGEAAERMLEVTARRVAAVLPGNVPLLEAGAIVARFSLAGVAGRRIEELRLVEPVITLPGTLPASGPAGGSGPPAAGWSVGRVVTHGGALRMAAAGDTVPGITGTVSFDLRELGTDAERAARPQHVGLRDVRVRYARRPTSLVVDDGRADFTVAGLLEQRIALVRVDRGLLVLDEPLRQTLATPSDGAAAASAWTLAVLDVQHLGIRLADLGPEIPDLTLVVRTRLTDVPLGPAGLARARTPQRIELSDITLDSPLDPFRPVVHVSSVFVDFTIADLLRRQLASIVIVSPTIYLGEDLIWYMNRTRTEAAAEPATAPWTARRVRAELGRLVLTFNGVDRAALPLNFRTDARDVSLGDLATLRLAAALRVPKQTYTFPGLDLELVNVEGELRFDFPPGQARNNVVNTLTVAEIRWRDYRIRDGWLSATFDGNGVNAELGGDAYEGYVDGGASLPFHPGPMTGWASCTDLDLAPIARTAGGAYLEMTGVIDLEGAVEVLGNRIDQARADLDFKRPGTLSFPSLDHLLDRLPPETSSWRRDLARIAIETFRDYPYDTGTGTLRLAGDRGEGHLGLDGARGKRQIDVFYYDLHDRTPRVVGREGAEAE